MWEKRAGWRRDYMYLNNGAVSLCLWRNRFLCKLQPMTELSLSLCHIMVLSYLMPFNTLPRMCKMLIDWNKTQSNTCTVCVACVCFCGCVCIAWIGVCVYSACVYTPSSHYSGLVHSFSSVAGVSEVMRSSADVWRISTLNKVKRWIRGAGKKKHTFS